MQQRFTQPEEWVSGEFTNADGANLHFGSLAVHENPVANIIIPGGLSEFTEKYFETARDLSKSRYNLYCMDWRGQGASERYLSDYFKRHSLGFDRDERDLLQFIDHHVPDNAPRVILAHSMGAVPTLLTIRDKPDKIQAAILTAPLAGFLYPFARGLELLLAKVPLDHEALAPRTREFMESYIPMGGPAGARNSPNDYSSDKDRMHLHGQWMAIDHRLTGRPEGNCRCPPGPASALHPFPSECRAWPGSGAYAGHWAGARPC